VKAFHAKISSDRVSFRAGETESVIRIGHQPLAALRQSMAGRPGVVVIDRKVAQKHAELLSDVLVDATGKPLERMLVTGGERAKTPDQLAKVWHFLAKVGLPRDGVIIGVGGGTILDLAGFAASTWMRGVVYIAVPTTLLAATDASVGGKTAINLDGLKNPVGTFHAAEHVLISPDLLATLPRREWSCGLAEMVKIGVINAPQLFKSLELHAPQLEQLLASGPATKTVQGILDLPWTAWLLQAVGAKARIVASDYREAGRRQTLNLGHTLAHALEPLLGLPHGEAVALGMMAATRLSRTRGTCPQRTVTRIESLLANCGLPTTCTPPTLKAVAPYIARDKKKTDGTVGWILPSKIGHVTLNVPVALDDVLPLLHGLD
jgi:3-dehydroquinate synthase